MFKLKSIVFILLIGLTSFLIPAKYFSIPKVKAQSLDPNRPYMIGWWGYMYNAPVLPDMGANMSSLTHSQDAAMLWSAGAGNEVDAYLDSAYANGIKVIFDLRLEVLQLSETRFRQMIRAYKDHPALYGWYISDEPDYNNTSASLIQTYYNIIKQEDPDHPVSLVFIGWYHHTDHLGVPYITAYDQLMIDWYPGWNSPNIIDSMIQQSYSIWKGGFDEAKRYGKKYLAIGLGFGTPWIVRNLTVDEYRYHTFSAIVLGVDGFLYWWTDWSYGRDPNNKANPTVVNNVNTVIRQVQAIGAEMLNGTTNDPQISTNQGAGNLVYRHGANGNRRVILAVNISGTSLSNVQFSLPAGTQATQVEVLDENRNISVSGGTFTDYFAPLAVHAYAFTTSGGSLPASPSPSPSPSPTTGSPSPSPALSPGLSVVRAPSGSVTIDGNLSEFSGANAVTFSDSSNRGTDDNTATVKTMWDNQYLYIAYDVSDTKLNSSASTAAIWEDDNLEILIDRNNDHGTWKGTDDHQYFVNLNNVRDDQGENLGANAFKSAVLLNGTLNNNSDTDQGYKIEMALAWSALGGAPAPGDRIGIDFAAGDKDLASDGYQYYDWANLTNFGQPDKWQDMVFTNEAFACPADINNDNNVNVDDIIQILQAWGECTDCREDFNGNGAVNVADVIAVLQAWGNCP